MKIPRDVSGKDLIKALKVYGYEVVGQNGSHIKVTTEQNGQHHIAIPNHNPIKIGTLNGILSEVAKHFGITKDEVVRVLFGQDNIMVSVKTGETWLGDLSDEELTELVSLG